MNASKKIALSFSILNFLSVIFFVVVAIIGGGNATVSTIFAAIALAVLCADIIYAVFSENFSFTRIIVSVVAVVLNFAFGILAGLSVFADSLNILGIIILICAYITNIVFSICSAFSTPKEKKESKLNKKLLRWILLITGLCGLLSVLIAGLVLVSVPTYVSTNAVNITAIMITLSVVFAALVIYGLKDKGRKTLFAILTLSICFIYILPYTIIEGFAYKDLERAEQSFVNAFGEVNTEGKLSSPYNFALEFTGISTKNYKLERDKVYFNGSGKEEGITLRYDAYYPAGKSKGVLVNLHGSGGDKDTGNYAHRNKYFASIGYTVFDIQFGDWNEAGTGKVPYYDSNLEWATTHLYHLDEFIKFASKKESNANWSNLFLTGVSMGGTQVSRYALSYQNSLTETGAVLRGIIPVYPGYSSKDEGVTNCLSNITSDSAPCLVIMGEYDTVVSPQAADEYKAAYDKAGNSYCAQIKISFAGHGCDYFMAGRSNQLLTYYMQNFMIALSK